MQINLPKPEVEKVILESLRLDLEGDTKISKVSASKKIKKRNKKSDFLEKSKNYNNGNKNPIGKKKSLEQAKK